MFRNKTATLIAVIGLGLAALSVSFKNEIADFYVRHQSEKKFVRVHEEYIKVELAVQPEEWARGLMFREHLGENEGMLFVDDQEKPRSFWMKNTLVSLDIIFISGSGEVIQIAEGTVPLSEESIPSGEPAQYILEIKAGQVSKLGIHIGDQLEFLFDIPKPKAN